MISLCLYLKNVRVRKTVFVYFNVVATLLTSKQRCTNVRMTSCAYTGTCSKTVFVFQRYKNDVDVQITLLYQRQNDVVCLPGTCSKTVFVPTLICILCPG